MQNFFNLTLAELTQEFENLGLKKFRARQLWEWIYKKGAQSFDEMTSLSAPDRELIQTYITIDRPSTHLRQNSNDGTIKWLLNFVDSNKAEMVYIPEEDRGALCVSSQVGCTLTCKFCHTGTQRLVRNLDVSEIVGQFVLARDALSEWNLQDEKRKLSNIVMMGMGEPFFNYDNVAKALQIIMDSNGINLSKRRITLSTSGVVPMIKRCGDELAVNLAVSLHAVRDDLRDVIVPLNKKYPIAELLQACRDYPVVKNSRRITFEYVMLKGVNDSDADAYELVNLIRDIPAKVNLIPFNPWPGAPYECSSNNRIRAFSDIVNKAGISAPVRTPRGRDILAACGQLKSDSERVKRHQQ